MRVSTTVLQARWRAPLLSAHGRSDTTRPLVLLELEAAGGAVGYGEGAPLESYDGVSLSAVIAALKDCGPALRSATGDDRRATLAECREYTSLPQALAAVDLALWDLTGRQLNRPVWELLGSATPQPIPVNAVIGAEDPRTAAREARAAVEQGYRCVKLKVGAGDDLARVREVREAVGVQTLLRLDANGAFGDPKSALDRLEQLAAFDIELCEEPVHGARPLAEVSAGSPVAVAADESTSDPALFSARCADAICLKIAAGGGIDGVLAEAHAARRLGYEVYLASTLDGPLGIAAALHAAAAIRPDRVCGLSTLERFVEPTPLTVCGGRLAPPPGPGLGDGLRGWYSGLAA